MPKKVFSGKEVIKILCKQFGFYFVSQRGSHVKLTKRTNSKEIITVVPLHKELAPGTLRGALDLAEVELRDFLKQAR